MAASVASTWGPGFVVGVRRPILFSGRGTAVRVRPVAASPEPARPRAAVSPFAPAVERGPRPAPPMRRRFEVGGPEAAPPVSRRARRIERPSSGSLRARPRVRRSRARAAAHHGYGTPARIRLTRRGRLLLLLLAAVAVYAAFGLGRASAGASQGPAHASSVVVRSGDSLWSIAVREFPRSDPRDVVGQVKALNRLSTSDLVAGQTLRLP